MGNFSENDLHIWLYEHNMKPWSGSSNKKIFLWLKTRGMFKYSGIARITRSAGRYLLGCGFKFFVSVGTGDHLDGSNCWMESWENATLLVILFCKATVCIAVPWPKKTLLKIMQGHNLLCNYFFLNKHVTKDQCHLPSCNQDKKVMSLVSCARWCQLVWIISSYCEYSWSWSLIFFTQ